MTLESPEVKVKPTSAVSRGLDDVDPMKWGAMIFLTSYMRWTVSHPFRLAMLRQRTTRTSTTVVGVLHDLYRTGGVRALFRGAGAAAFGNAFGETMYIALFECMRHSQGPLAWIGIESSLARDSVAGTAGDLFNVVLASPFEVIAARQMTAGCGIAAGLTYMSAYRTARSLIRQHGHTGFFAGMLPSLAYSSSSALWWAIYEPLKGALYEALTAPLERLPETYPRIASNAPPWAISPCDNFLINASSGVVASVICTSLSNPLFVVGTRLQVGLGRSTPTAQRKKYMGSTVLWVLQDLWRNEGIRGLTKGMKVSVAMAVVEGLLFSQTYEVTKFFADSSKW